MASKRWFRVTALLATLTVILTMVLGSCGKKGGGDGWTPQETAALFSAGFSTQAEIVLGEMALSGELSREGTRTSLSLTAPEHLEGLSFSVEGGKADVTYKGLSVQGDKLPVPALGRAVALVMDALTHPELLTAGTDENGEPILSGKTENGVFTLVMDDTAPLSLEIPELQLSCTFTGFTPAEPGGAPIPPASSQGESGSPEEASSLSGEGSSEASGDLGTASSEGSAGEDVSSLQQGDD